MCLSLIPKIFLTRSQYLCFPTNGLIFIEIRALSGQDRLRFSLKRTAHFKYFLQNIFISKPVPIFKVGFYINVTILAIF